MDSRPGFVSRLWKRSSRRLKEEAIERVKVGHAKNARIPESIRASSSRRSPELSDPDRSTPVASLRETGCISRRIAGGQSFRSSVFRLRGRSRCHGRSKIAMQYLRVTRAATGVCSAHGRYHVDGRLLCVPQNSQDSPMARSAALQPAPSGYFGSPGLTEESNGFCREQDAQSTLVIPLPSSTV
jgi:hypothetical protein